MLYLAFLVIPEPKNGILFCLPFCLRSLGNCRDVSFRVSSHYSYKILSDKKGPQDIYQRNLGCQGLSHEILRFTLSVKPCAESLLHIQYRHIDHVKLYGKYMLAMILANSNVELS